MTGNQRNFRFQRNNLVIFFFVFFLRRMSMKLLSNIRPFVVSMQTIIRMKNKFRPF